MTKQEIIQYLYKTAKPFKQIDSFSSKPGIYAVSFWGIDFPLEEAEDSIKKNTILYIGKTLSSQEERDLEQHFTSGQTRRSTLRRTFGALLMDSFNLEPIPRSNTEASDRKYVNYRFIDKEENIITNWMIENLGLSFYEYPKKPYEIEKLETTIIREVVPPLNIQKNDSNPFLAILKKKRALCAQKARESDGLYQAMPQELNINKNKSTMTLHEAMKIVLKECPGKTATFEYISDEIHKRGLYNQKAGGKAPSSQIRLRARKHPHMFEVIPSNKVRLI